MRLRSRLFGIKTQWKHFGMRTVHILQEKVNNFSLNLLVTVPSLQPSKKAQQRNALLEKEIYLTNSACWRNIFFTLNKEWVFFPHNTHIRSTLWREEGEIIIIISASKTCSSVYKHLRGDRYSRLEKLWTYPLIWALWAEWLNNILNRHGRFFVNISPSMLSSSTQALQLFQVLNRGWRMFPMLSIIDSSWCQFDCRLINKGDYWTRTKSALFHG